MMVMHLRWWMAGDNMSESLGCLSRWGVGWGVSTDKRWIIGHKLQGCRQRSMAQVRAFPGVVHSVVDRRINAGWRPYPGVNGVQVDLPLGGATIRQS